MMPALAQRYTVIAPDLRGLGDSDKPDNSGNKQIAAEDIYQLCRALGYDRIFLVAHDWGTSAAYVMAQEHPEFIRRLVLSDNTIPGLDLPGVMTFQELNNIPYHHNFHAEPDTPEALISGKERFYLTNFYKKLTYNWATFTPDYIDEFVRAYTQPGALRAGFGYYRAIASDDRYIRRYSGRKLQMPVLGVTGDHATNEYLHLQLRPVTTNYRGYVMERTGHFLPIERPTEFTQLILKFFGEER
jgi:pimeloyl-ACP methyl ester carboxylesterase